MPRPKHCLCKTIKFKPDILYFKPQGVPMRNLQTVELSLEEIEAYRLRHREEMDQQVAAEKMNTSTSTYQRILYSAYKKIADAIINGKAIRITKHK